MGAKKEADEHTAPKKRRSEQTDLHCAEIRPLVGSFGMPKRKKLDQERPKKVVTNRKSCAIMMDVKLSAGCTMSFSAGFADKM